MQKKSFFLLFFLALTSGVVVAQNAQKGAILFFDEVVYDFGTIAEEGGSVEHQFIFQNVGETPLRIDSVLASCGCTTPSWTTTEVVPGGFGYVTARYEPMYRPGEFNKYLTVFSNADQRITQLLIKGNVTPRPKTIADTLVVKLGAVRMASQAFNFGEITNEKPTVREFDIYNDSTAAITFQEQVVTSPYITVAFEPKTLAPKQKGKIIITYDPVLKNDYGYSFDNLIVATDEPQSFQKQCYVVATIKEYFPPMTEEQLANAPKLMVENTTFDFGNVQTNQQYSTQFRFTNIGKEPLIIRATKASCGCTATEPDKKVLAPGETGTISVNYNSYGTGQQQKIITIFSNDPTNSSQELYIKANVLQ